MKADSRAPSKCATAWVCAASGHRNDVSLLPRYARRGALHSRQGQRLARGSFRRASAEELTSKRMFDVLDLCLECKGCKRECPSNVDLAKIKYEFFGALLREARHAVARQDVRGIENLNKWGSRFAPLANAVMGLNPSSGCWINSWALTAADRCLRLRVRASEKWFRKRSGAKRQRAPQGRALPRLLSELQHPQVGHAATELLEIAATKSSWPTRNAAAGR